MPRHKTGSAVKVERMKGGKKVVTWYARITWLEGGKQKEKRSKPTTNTKTAAKELAKKMVHKLEEEGEQILEGDKMTFAQLADFFEKNYLLDPEYQDDRKVRGYRSKYEIGLRLNMLKAYFGSKKIRAITHGHINAFRSDRLNTPVVFGKNTRGTNKPGNITERKRSLGTVHKELGLLRRVLNVAVSNGWLIRNPFSMGDALINPADEKQRERIITKEEEERLLNVCVDHRAHLRPIVIMALDTGMRLGEMMKLRWKDIDLENRVFNIKALNTKTIRERDGGMSKRLFSELERMWNQSNKEPEDKVFVWSKTKADKYMNPKKSFDTARQLAGLTDVRFHDLRHTHGSRLAARGLPISEIARTLGHTQINTTYRYLNANKESRARVVSIIDEINDESNEATIH
jgi:integrase